MKRNVKKPIITVFERLRQEGSKAESSPEQYDFKVSLDLIVRPYLTPSKSTTLL